MNAQALLGSILAQSHIHFSVQEREILQNLIVKSNIHDYEELLRVMRVQLQILTTPNEKEENLHQTPITLLWISLYEKLQKLTRTKAI